MIRYIHCICKTQIDVQALIDVQSSNPCPNSTLQTSVPQISNSHIGVQFSNLSFFKFSNQRPILKYMTVSHFLKSTLNDATDECLNPYPNQKIGHRSENLERTPI